MKEIKLIVGLGNKGKEYENTPHNIGFRVIDNLLSGTKFPIVKKFGGEIIKDKEKKVMYLKPMTFMNNSGKTVSSIIAEYKIKIENILIIHDELDFPYGSKPKLDFNRSSAGHKGVKSIIDFLKSQNFHRLRIGIMPEQKPENVNDYLTNYNIKGKLKKIDKEVIEKATKIVKDWIISV